MLPLYASAAWIISGGTVGAFARALADRVDVLEKGAVRYSCVAAELREDKALVDRLLSL